MFMPDCRCSFSPTTKRNTASTIGHTASRQDQQRGILLFTLRQLREQSSAEGEEDVNILFTTSPLQLRKLTRNFTDVIPN